MRSGIVILMLILISSNIKAQTESVKYKPSWLDDAGKPVSDYYEYYVGFGENNSLQNARDIAMDDVYAQISDEIKANYQVSSLTKTEITNNQTGNSEQTVSDFEFVGIVEKTGEKISVSGIREVEYYWAQVNAKYQYWVLFRKPRTGTSDARLPLYKNDNGSVWRSVVYPGWGQLYNQQRTKGIVLLCGESLSLAGIIAGQLMYSSNIDQANATTNQNRDIYLDNANSWETVRNMSSIAAGVIWIYNIIDATTSSKRKLYSNADHRQIEIFPGFNDKSYVLTVCINFK